MKTEPDDEGGANERVICCRSDDFCVSSVDQRDGLINHCTQLQTKSWLNNT